MDFSGYQVQPRSKLIAQTGDLLLQSIHEWSPNDCNQNNLSEVIRKLSKNVISKNECEKKVNKFMKFAKNHTFDGTPERINQLYRSWKLHKQWGNENLGLFGREDEEFQQASFEDEMPKKYQNPNCSVLDMWGDLMQSRNSHSLFASPFPSNSLLASEGYCLNNKKLGKSEQIEKWKSIQEQKRQVIYNHFCLRVIDESLLEEWYKNNIWSLLICKKNNGNIIIHGQPLGSKGGWQWTEFSDPNRMIKINAQTKFIQTDQLPIDAFHLITQGHREDSKERWEPSYLIARNKRERFTTQALHQKNHEQDYALTEGLCLLLKNKLKDLDRTQYMPILSFLDPIYETIKEFSPAKKNLPRIVSHDIMQNIIQKGLQDIQIMHSIHEWFAFLNESWVITKAYQRNKAAFEQVCCVVEEQNFKDEVTRAIMKKELQVQKKQNIDRKDVANECLKNKTWGRTSIQIIQDDLKKNFFVQEEISLYEWKEKWLQTKYEKKILQYFKQCSDDLLIFMNQSEIIINEIQNSIECAYVLQHSIVLSKKNLQSLFNKILSWFTPLNIHDKNLREVFFFEIEKEYKSIFQRHIATIQEENVKFQLYLHWMTPWLIAFQGIQEPAQKERKHIEKTSEMPKNQIQTNRNNSPLQISLPFQQSLFLYNEMGLKLSQTTSLTVLELIECLLEDQGNRLAILHENAIPKLSHWLHFIFLANCDKSTASRYIDYIQRLFNLIIKLEEEKQRLWHELNDCNINHFLELLILAIIRYVRSGSNYNLRAIQSFIDNPEHQIEQLFQDLQIHAFSPSSFSLVQAKEMDASSNAVPRSLPNLGTSCFFNQAMLTILSHANHVKKILNLSREEELMEVDSKAYLQEIALIRSQSRKQIRELIAILQGQRQIDEDKLMNLLQNILFFSLSFSRGQHHDPDEAILKIQDLFGLESANVPIAITDQQFSGREVSMQELVSEIVLPPSDESIILTINRSSYFRCKNRLFLLKCDKKIQELENISLPISNELKSVSLHPVCFTCHSGFGINGEGGHYTGFYQSQTAEMWIYFDDKKRFETNISDITVLLKTYPLILNHCTQIVYQIDN